MVDTLHFSRVPNSWLASTAGNIAVIFANYWEKPFELDSEEVEEINDFEKYLDIVKKGQNYENEWTNKGLFFDRSTLEAFNALREVVLVASDVEKFIDKLKSLFNNIKKEEEVNKDLLWDYKKTLLDLSEIVSRNPFNPETSHTL